MAQKTVEQLEVVIQANADQFRKELADVVKKLGTMEQSASGSAKSLRDELVPSMVKSGLIVKGVTKAFEVFGRVLRKVFNVIADVIKKVITGGSELARMTIATNTIAQNMGIAADEVDGLRDSLADANTYGVAAEQVIRSLALTGLFQMAESLKAVDARTGEYQTGVSALVLSMKDLAAASGRESAEGIAVLTRFIQGNNAAVQEGILQIGNMGTEYRMFEKQLGKSRNMFSSEEEAWVRMQIVMREGQKALGAYANTYTTSGKMVNSINEAMAANYQLLGGALEPVWASVSSAVLTFVNNVRSFLMANLETVREWAIKVSAWVIYVVRGLGRLLMKLPVVGGYMKNLAEFQFPQVKVSAENTAKSIKKVAGGMDNASKSAKDLKKELAGLAGFDEMNVLNPPEPSAGGVGGMNVSGLGAGEMDLGGLFDLNEIADEVTEKVNQMEESWGTFNERIIEFTELPLVSFLLDNWKTIALVLGVVVGLTVAIGVVISAVTTWATAFGAIVSVGGWLVGAIGSVISAIGAVVVAIGWIPILIALLVGVMIAAVITIIKNWDTIKVWFEDFFYQLGVWWNEGVEGWKLIINNVVNWLKDRWEDFGNYWNEAVEGWGIIFSNIGNWFKNVWNSVTGWLKEKWNQAVDWVKLKTLQIAIGVLTLVYRVRGYWIQMKNTAIYYVNILKDKVTNIFNKVSEGISNSFERVVNRLKWLINTFVLTPLNNARLIINKIPGVNIGKIPYLAEGGIISSPTVAMLGEAGKEAVVPLENNTEWIDQLASKIGGTGGQPIHLTVKLGEEKIAEKVIDTMNDKATRTGNLVFNV